MNFAPYSLGLYGRLLIYSFLIFPTISTSILIIFIFLKKFVTIITISSVLIIVGITHSISIIFLFNCFISFSSPFLSIYCYYYGSRKPSLYKFLAISLLVNLFVLYNDISKYIKSPTFIKGELI